MSRAEARTARWIARPRVRWPLGLAALLLVSGSAAWNLAPAPDPRSQAVPAPALDTRAAQLFERFALNALLAPLLDDGEPANWTDVGLRLVCGPATHVTVDGRPLVVGSPLPPGPFTLRWHIDQCWPLDYSTFELTGTVELRIAHDGAGATAVVDAGGLRVSGSRGSGKPAAPFVATLAFGSAAPPVAAVGR